MNTRVRGLLGIVAAGALILTGCGDSGEPSEAPEATSAAEGTAPSTSCGSGRAAAGAERPSR